MVRLAGMLQLIERGYKIFPETNNRIDELLDQVILFSKKLLKKQESFLEDLLVELKEKNCEIIKNNFLSISEKKWLENWYKKNLLQLLAPTTLDPNHPFPFIQNKGKLIFLELTSPDEKSIRSVITIPEKFERLVLLPGKKI